MIKGTEVWFSPEEKAAMMDRLRKVVESNYFMWGDQQEEFQARIAKLTNRKHAMTYSSVTFAAEAIFHILKPRIVAFQGNQFPSVVFAAIRQDAMVRMTKESQKAVKSFADKCLDEKKNINDEIIARMI